MPTNFNAVEIESIMSKVSPRLYKTLREVFVVISDDCSKPDHTRQLRGAPNQDQRQEPPEVMESEPVGQSVEARSAPDRPSKRQNPSPATHNSKSAKK